MTAAVSSVELCCVFCGIRIDVACVVLAACTLGRCWCHAVLEAFLRYLATIRNCGNWTHRELHDTEGLHFQSILRIRGYHGDHRKGTVGFGETPIVVPAIPTINAFQWVHLRDSRVYCSTVH